jgi:hypothetical protein
MFDINEKKTGNTIWQFRCYYRKNRSGFVHDCELFRNGFSKTLQHRQYYNRTWESYEYQSVMLDCVQEIKDRILTRAVRIWKEQNNRTRITKEQKEKVIENAKQSAEFVEAQELYELVLNAKYGTEEERKNLETLDALIEMLKIIKSA